MRRAIASRSAFRDPSVTPSRFDVNGGSESERVSPTVWFPIEYATADVALRA